LEINNTIITKIYQYVSVRKPILTGQAKMMRDFIVKYNLGLAANEKDPVSIAETVLEMKGRLDSFTFEVPDNIMYWEYTSLQLLRKYNEFLTGK